jgi:molecular chaperone DnaJ
VGCSFLQLSLLKHSAFIFNERRRVNHGGQIRLAGLGEIGQHGGSTGDLYVSFRIKQHRFFSRKNDDLYCDVPKTFAQAVLGADIEVPTLKGRIALQVPAGTVQDTKFRIKGKGVKKMGSGTNGDLYIKVKVMIPKQLNARQRALLESFDAFKDKSGYLFGIS